MSNKYTDEPMSKLEIGYRFEQCIDQWIFDHPEIQIISKMTLEGNAINFIVEARNGDHYQMIELLNEWIDSKMEQFAGNVIRSTNENDDNSTILTVKFV